MSYLVAKARFEDPVCFALRDIFSAMNTDDDDIICILFFDLPQLRKDVYAVDSAIRPEVEQYDFPAQRLQRQRFASRMYPVEA
jgi:hypothetical protein